MTTLRRVLAATALAFVLLAAAACTGGHDAESASHEAEDSDGGGMATEEAMPPEEGFDESGGTDAGVNRTLVTVRSVIMTGEVAVTSNDLDEARMQLDEVLDALGGTIDSEQTQNDDDGTIKRSSLVIRVPVDTFRAAMTALQGLGTMKHSDSASKDVTTQVIDVDERVETLENSLDRLQDYQRDAQDIDDLIRFEQQITQREAELQSLTSQQDYLADQTSMSTIRLYLSTPKEYVAPSGALDDAGFVSGLAGGWNALKDTVVVVLTVVGAVLPFLVAFALLGVPLWLLVRRAHQARTADPAEPDAPAIP